MCFFVSGAAGLLYEVVWFKQLSYLLGTSLHAVATVVSAFLCGLALGARFLGPRLGRRTDGARVYALLELGVAVLGLISLPVLRGLDPLVGVLYRSLSGEGAAFGVARVALMFAVLIPPAALMGATLPVLVARLERERIGPAMARLYAVNTLGAVAGTLAGGFVLLPTLGLTITTWIAAGLNIAAASLAWRVPARVAEPQGLGIGDGSQTLADATQASAHADESLAARTHPSPFATLAGRARLTFALLFMLSGFTALTFQIAWVRIFTLVFGSSVYSFSAVLGIYLLGLAIGSACIAPYLRRGASLAAFGLLQLALAAAAAFQLISFSSLPEWMFGLAERSGANWNLMFFGEVTLLAAFLIVPCALLGAAFPLATALLQRRDAGHAAGVAYAVNTVGTIAGSLIAGFVAIPTWGAQATHVFTLCLAAAIGLAATWLAYSRREIKGRNLGLAGATLAAVAALAIVAPRWEPNLMSIGAFRPIQALNAARTAQTLPPSHESLVRRVAKSERILYYAEGINGSVLVATRGDGHERWLRIGGKVDASLGRDMETQVMVGMIPTACADSGARALVIGLGSGFTLSAVLAAGAGPTEVVELEPRVVDASRFFHATDKHPLDDPRVHLALGDARTHLEYSENLYGVIVSEPTNPWIAGVNSLFTVDFYQKVRSHLEPRGVFCQWVQLYELSPETLASLLASFLEVFPEGQAYRMCRGADLVLVATPPVNRLALERLQSPESRRVLERVGIRSPEGVAGYYIGPLSSLRRFTGGARLNRDDLPIVEYRAPQDLVTVGRAAAPANPLPRSKMPAADTPPEGPLFSAWSREGWFESRTKMLVEQGDIGGAAATARAASYAGLTQLGQRLSEEVDAGIRSRQAAEESEKARALFNQGRGAEGLQALRHAAELDPTNGRLWLWIADRRRLEKDFSGAEADLARGRAIGDTMIQADAALISGMLEIDRSQPMVAAKRFREIQRLSPQRADGYLYEAAARAAGGDSVGARAALRRGLEQLPGEQHLTALLAVID